MEVLGAFLAPFRHIRAIGFDSKLCRKWVTKWSQHVLKNNIISQHLPNIVPKSSSGGGFRRFGSVWGDLGASLSILGPSWGRLGSVFGRLGAVLGACWGRRGASGSVLGRLELDFHKIPSRIPCCTRFVIDFA